MISEVHIQTALRDDITYLKKSFYTPPFKVADITEDRTEKTLHLMLMSSSPGVLNGDDYRIKIEVAKDCSLQLQTQSYQRLFQMKKSAIQQTHICLEQDASFFYLPHPSVPHHGSNFSSRNKIFLSEGCCLLWGEVLTCGRGLNGEVFQFTRYHNLTEIFVANRLVIKENLLMQPAVMDVAAMGQLEGYTHQASLIYLNEKASVKALINSTHELLNAESNIVFGISATPVNGFLVRLLGYKAEQLHGCLQTIAKSLVVSAKQITAQKTVYAT